MELAELDDPTLVGAFLEQPPPRHLLPRPGERSPGPAEARLRKALFRALSCTDHERIRKLLFSGLTEPVYRDRGSMAKVEPFAAVAEAARMTRMLVTEGWTHEIVRERLLGLQQLWEELQHTAPDTWRALDVARTLCDWHRDGQPVTQIYRGIEAARALWRSEGGEVGLDLQHHFANFLAALIVVF